MAEHDPTRRTLARIGLSTAAVGGVTGAALWWSHHHRQHEQDETVEVTAPAPTVIHPATEVQLPVRAVHVAEWWETSHTEQTPVTPPLPQSKVSIWKQLGWNALYTVGSLSFMTPVIGIAYWLFSNQKLQKMSAGELVAWVVAATVSFTLALVVFDQWGRRIQTLRLSVLPPDDDRSQEFVWVEELLANS